MPNSLHQETYVVTGIIKGVSNGLEICYDALLPYFHAACNQRGWPLDTETGEAMAKPLDQEAAQAQLAEYITRHAINRHTLPDDKECAEIVAGGGWHRLKIRSHKPKTPGEPWLIELLGSDNLGNPVNLNDLLLRHRFAPPASV